MHFSLNAPAKVWPNKTIENARATANDIPFFTG
jgi:hypothetical protein